MTETTERRPSDRLKQIDRYIHVLVEHFYLRLLEGAASNLNGSELFALSLLGRKGKGSMTELAQDCALALSSMTGVVDRLVVKGWVKRAWDKKDRRKVYVELDKKGEKVYRRLLEGEMQMIITMMESLKIDEQDTLLNGLRKAVGAVKV